MNDLIEFYRKKLGFKDFYNIIKNNIKSNPNDYIQNSRFLETIEASNISSFKNIKAKPGDLRIDVPVWFGNFEMTEYKIVVAGREPRDTNSDFNVEHIDNKIFACPFGVDRWNKQSSIKGKPQNKYYRVFDNLICDNKFFMLFTDIVKEYEIVGNADDHARDTFDSKAESSKDLFIEEIKKIKPNVIISLGNETFSKIDKWFQENFEILKVPIRHPSHGGEKEAKAQLKDFLQKISSVS